MSIKITYLNINGLDKSKLTFIEESIANQDADIFIIAEHWFSCFHLLVDSPYFMQSSNRPTSRKSTGHENGGIAILADPSTQKVLSILSSEEFAITFAIAKKTITAVYFPPRLSQERIEEQLSNSIASDIIFGDINVRFGKSSNDAKTWNLKRGISILRLLESANFFRINAKSECSRNDHIFSKNPLTWNYIWLPKETIKTDHGAILVELHASEPPAPTEPTKRYALRTLKNNILSDALAENFEQTHCYRLQEIVSRMELKLLKEDIASPAILQSTANCIDTLLLDAIFSVCDKHLPYYDAEKIKLQKEDKLFTNEPDATTGYLNAIKIFKRSQRLFSKQHIIRPRNPSNSAINEAFSHYQDIYNSHTTPKLKLHTIDLKEPMASNLFSPELIKICILKYNSSKACGPDGLHIKILKCLASKKSFIELISQIFRLYYRSNTTPESWNLSLIHLLIKDTSQPFADKTRPISLTQILRRIFEKCIYNHWICKSWTNVHPNQAGFRQGYSTYSHIILADHLIRRKKPVAIFLDLKSAFDRVSHEKLLQVLEARHCPPRDTNIIYSLMLKSTKSIITCNHARHKTHISRSCGLFQGSILSPMLFNLYIDSLAISLNDVCTSLLFADDILILAESVDKAKKCLSIADSWSIDYNMEFNAQKSGTWCKSSSLLINNELIPNVHEYKYLGVPMTATGVDWLKLIKTLRSKSENLRVGIQSRSSSWNSLTKLTIFRSFIRPILEYGLPLVTNWSRNQPKTIRDEVLTILSSFHNTALEWIFNRRGNSPLLSSISGLGSLNFRIQQLEASLATHISKLSISNPLIKLQSQIQFRTSSDDFYLQCRKSALISLHKEKPDLKWKTFVIKQKLMDPLLTNSRLVKCIAPRCRTPSGVDRCMYESNSDLFLRWRLNRCFINSICSECKKIFNRSHIRKCFVIPSALCKIQRLNPPNPDVINYNILDELLNRKSYVEFEAVFRWIEKKIHAATWDRTPDIDAFP